MQYKCETCHDSGSKNQTGDYLDCPACDMPHTRKALNDFVKSLGPTHPEDVALAIHQRAIAMAPKQEAPEPVAQDCGACLSSGWVPRDSDIGTEQECFSCDGSGKSDDAAPAAANGAPENIWRLIDAYSDVRAVYQYSTARHLAKTQSENLDFAKEELQKALAAAGPDAALVKALEMAEKKFLELEHMLGGGDDEVSVEVEILTIRAALSGAKGN